MRRRRRGRGSLSHRPRGAASHGGRDRRSSRPRARNRLSEAGEGVLPYLLPPRLTSCDIAGTTVYTGHGGDILQGNDDHIYADVEASAEAQGLSPDELRTRLKSEYYDRSQAAFFAGAGGETGRHIASIVEALGGEIVLPYRDPRLAYVSRIPYEVLRPAQKRFVKDALRRRYGLGDLVERRRASIQEGTGIYDSFKARLEELARTQGLSRRELVARLSA
jgi:class 3 adenylate cyclase